MNKKSFFKAFTLAEVLITLVIIGVIAAITVPTIHANYVEQERKAKVKKTYSVLSQAMIRIQATGVDMEFEEIDGNSVAIRDWYNKYMAPFLVTQKVCFQTKGCWNKGDTYWLNGSKHNWNRTGVGVGSDIVTAVLNDGTFINIDGFSISDMKSIFGIDAKGKAGFVLYYDINGDKKPNVIGRDIYVAVYSREKGFVPAFKDRNSSQIKNDCSKSGRGVSCIMNYLREH